MIWSSNSGGPRGSALGPSDADAATAWGWTDLERTTPEAEERILADESRMQEVDDAYRRGLREGEDRGARQARDELQVAMRSMREILEEVRANREAWDASLQERLVVLSAAIARRVMERTAEEDDAVFVELARRAVAAFPAEEALRVRLHPRDHAVLSDPALLDEVVDGRTVRWIADDDVLPGGCVVEGPDRIVDARLDEVLCRIVRTLTDG